MTEVLDIVSNIVLLPYHITKAILMFLLANFIIVIVLISVLLIVIITIIAIFPGFFLRVTLFVVFSVIGLGLAGCISLIVIPVVGWLLSLISLILLVCGTIGGVILYIVKNPSWQRILFGLLGGPFLGMGLLGWVIGEYIESAFQRPDMTEFAQRVQGIMTAYDGKGASSRHRAAIAIKPGSKYYGLALSMSEKEDINKTDSGKFWVTQEIPDTIFLFQPAYDNLNLSPFN